MDRPTKYDHNQARSAFQTALDGSLDHVQREMLDQHLEKCAECRQYTSEMTTLDHQITKSLQKRWPKTSHNSSNVASTLAKIQGDWRNNHMMRNMTHTMRSLGWIALVILLVAGLVWTIKTLAPIPNQGPVGLSTPVATNSVLQLTQSPLPSAQPTPAAPPITPTAAPLLPGAVDLFPNVSFSFASALPDSPDQVMLYNQILSEPVTSISAHEVANTWGINGNVYTSPSEGMNDLIFDVMDGTRSIRFLNFPDQFIYQVDYTSPDYSSSLMDNGPLPSFDEQVAAAIDFLQPLGILDLPYQTMPMETEKGMVAFIPLLDGYPVIQEIGVDRSNIGWVDVKLSSAGKVTMVQYSHHDFQPVDDYPILSAQQAWYRFAADTTLQHARYAILSPEQPDTYQSWVPSYQPGDRVDLYGYVTAHQPADPSTPPLVLINDLTVSGNISGLTPSNQYDVRFVHAWGQIESNSVGGISLNLASWEISSLTDQYITGTIQIQDDQVQVSALDTTYILQDPPANLPEGAQVGIQSVILEGTPPILNWKYIETGQIPFSYGSSSSCGGSGGGGNSSSDANFGGGSFALLSLTDQNQPTATQINLPYQLSEEINDVSGRVYVTRHIYPGGNPSTEGIFSPDASSGLNMEWAYSLVGDALTGIEQYNNLPITISGQVERMENNIVYLNVTHYEPVYPGEHIQVWTGTEQILTLEGQEAVLFTTSDGNSYVLKSSIDYPPADANIIGRLGDLIEIEGYIIPDQQMGGYLLLQETAGTTQPDGVADSAQVNVWDHSQDPGSNPGAVLEGQVIIDKVELAYDAINLDRCQASAATDPNIQPWLYIQPMWVFTGHFDDGRRFIAQVQALPDEYYK